MRNTRQWLLEEHSIAPLVSFRILFGVLTLWSSLRYYLNDWVTPLFEEPSFFFKYYGFEWVPILDGPFIHLPFILMFLGAFGILFGFFYRWSAALFFLAFTYVELIDLTNYLNHYYLVSLLAFLLIFLPAHRAFSLDIKWRKKEALSNIPRWCILLIQCQLICVYFFAGIAKINSDWLLEAEPLFTWLQSHRDVPVFGPIFAHKTTAYIFSWAGCVFDLSVGFLLLIRRTRLWAYIAVIIFHLLTAYLFPIGVFPFAMILLNLIFFSSNWHEQWIPILKRESAYKSSPILFYFAIAYLTFQLLFPWRYLFYEGPLFWREEGFRFSWRVMLMHKEGHARFYICDQKTGGKIEINNREFLNPRQEEQMSTQPDMILQYAAYLYDRFDDSTFHISGQSYTVQDPEVRAQIFVSLNGRPAQKFVDTTHNLVDIPRNLSNRHWIEPFTP